METFYYEADGFISVDQSTPRDKIDSILNELKEKNIVYDIQEETEDGQIFLSFKTEVEAEDYSVEWEGYEKDSWDYSRDCYRTEGPVQYQAVVTNLKVITPETDIAEICRKQIDDVDIQIDYYEDGFISYIESELEYPED